MNLIRWTLFWLALIAAFVGLATFTPEAHAGELEARQDADWIRINDAPCTDEGVKARVAPEMFSEMRAARALIGGKTFSACWLLLPDAATIGVVYEDGDTSTVPAGMFREPRGA